MQEQRQAGHCREDAEEGEISRSLHPPRLPRIFTFDFAARRQARYSYERLLLGEHAMQRVQRQFPAVLRLQHGLDRAEG